MRSPGYRDERPQRYADGPPPGYDVALPASAAQSMPWERAAFIRRTYATLAGAVLALIGVEAVLLNIVDHQAIIQLMFGSPWSWLVVMLLFMGAGVVARIWAQSQSSRALQYAGLGLYVLAWAIMFAPLIIVANKLDPNVIPQAGIMTGAVFGGLTLAVFVTRKDFTFLGPILSVASLIVLGVIVAACFGLVSLGLLFCLAMVALISGYILYDTSAVMRHYGTDQHVAAALELLADVALLFWYIVQIMLSLSSRD
jgi:FtsH-binding integral membrane protein